MPPPLPPLAQPTKRRTDGRCTFRSGDFPVVKQSKGDLGSDLRVIVSQKEFAGASRGYNIRETAMRVSENRISVGRIGGVSNGSVI